MSTHPSTGCWTWTLSARQSVALVSLGSGSTPPPAPSPQVGPLSLRTVPISDSEKDFPAIREMHDASSLADPVRGGFLACCQPAPERQSQPAGPVTTLCPLDDPEIPQDSIETVIRRRGSTRRFAQEPITLQQLSTVLDKSTQGIPADFLNPPGSTLNDIYLIANAVDGLASGAYVFHRDLRSLELLAEGEFRYQAGYLGLTQQLPADASVNIYLLADLGTVLERFGNRGYRAAQLEASTIAGKMYLAAYAQRLGATGLTFYDDGVTQFFSPHAEGKSVMFLVAVGKRARRALIDVDTGGLQPGG